MHRNKAALAAAFLLLIFAFIRETPAQPGSIYRLPAGTRITLKLETELSSKFSSKGDTFIAKTARPVLIKDAVALPAAIELEGLVLDVRRAGASRRGRLNLVFQTIRAPGGLRTIDAVLAGPVEADSRRSYRLASILAGAAMGTAVGASAGGGGRTLAGAAIGGGIGALVAYLIKGSEARLASGKEFEIVLRSEVTLPVLDY